MTKAKRNRELLPIEANLKTALDGLLPDAKSRVELEQCLPTLTVSDKFDVLFGPDSSAAKIRMLQKDLSASPLNAVERLQAELLSSQKNFDRLEKQLSSAPFNDLARLEKEFAKPFLEIDRLRAQLTDSRLNGFEKLHKLLSEPPFVDMTRLQKELASPFHGFEALQKQTVDPLLSKFNKFEKDLRAAPFSDLGKLEKELAAAPFRDLEKLERQFPTSVLKELRNAHTLSSTDILKQWNALSPTDELKNHLKTLENLPQIQSAFKDALAQEATLDKMLRLQFAEVGFKEPLPMLIVPADPALMKMTPRLVVVDDGPLVVQASLDINPAFSRLLEAALTDEQNAQFSTEFNNALVVLAELIYGSGPYIIKGIGNVSLALLLGVGGNYIYDYLKTGKPPELHLGLPNNHPLPVVQIEMRSQK